LKAEGLAIKEFKSAINNESNARKLALACKSLFKVPTTRFTKIEGGI
jgi:hypothetical protein